MSNERLSQKLYECGQKWVAARKRSYMLKEAKSARFAQMVNQSLVEDMPVNRAEHQVRASPEWFSYLENMVEADAEENLAWLQVETIKMRNGEKQSEEATARAEMRL